MSPGTGALVSAVPESVRARLAGLPRPRQLLFWAACTCQVAVWLVVSIGGMENPGFRQYEQYLSTLAARGASAPSWGVAALLLLAVGLLSLVPILLRWRGFVAGCVAVAGVNAAAIAFLPLPCPPQERFCVSPSIGPSLEVPHAVAVLVMCGALISAVVAGIIQLRAGGEHRPRVWPAVVVALALVAIGSDWLLSLTGLAQRGWLLFGQAAMLAVAAGALGELDRRDRLAAKRLAVGPVRGAAASTLGRPQPEEPDVGLSPIMEPAAGTRGPGSSGI